MTDKKYGKVDRLEKSRRGKLFRKHTLTAQRKVNKKTAELVLSMVERIIAVNAAGVSLDAESARWTANIDDTLHGKLVKAGVLSERQRRTLGKFIADYIAERSDWNRVGTCAMPRPVFRL